MILVRMAFRNLIKHLRRTLITGTSIAVGVAILLWYQCIVAGRNENMIRTITTSYTGYFQIFKKGYRESRAISDTFDAKPLIGQLEKKGFQSTSRLHIPSLIASGEQSLPILIEGIQPGNESQVTKLKSQKTEGEYLSNDPNGCQEREIYIGQALAKALNVEIDSKLVLLTQMADGGLGNDLFRVRGIYKAGSADFEKKLAFVHEDCLQAFAGVQNSHEIVIAAQADQESDLRKWFSDLKKSNVELTTWRESLPDVSRMVRFNDASTNLITWILFAVIVLGVVNTLLMNVFERTREFGVMLALGTTPGQLQKLILFETFFLGLISILVGSLFGLGAVAYHRIRGFDLSYFFGELTGTDGFVFDLVIKPIFEPSPFLKLVAISFVFIIVAGVYPAFRASRLNPIDVMRS